MKTLLTITVCLCLIAALTPVVSAVNLTPTNIEWYGDSCGSEVQPVDNFIDGVYATYAEWSKGESGGCFHQPKITYGAGIMVTGCYVTPGSYQQNWNFGNQSVPSVYHQVLPEHVATNVSFGTTPVILGSDGVLYINRDWVPFIGREIVCYGIPGVIAADFNATPTNGTAPLFVSFQDTSTSGPTSYNWTITPANGLIGNTTTSAYPTIAFTQSGNYTVRHCAANIYSSDCEEKTDYIWVQNATTDLVSTTFWAVDPLGHRVWDSAISLQDAENSSWTNTSSPSGGVATITSLFGHTINGYAEAAGYNDGETLGIPADGVSGGIILMTPTNITNVSAGYVTLYVYVKEATGNAPIPGVYVNLAYAEGGSTHNDGGTTSSEGLTSFVVPKETLIYVYGEKVGYEKVSTTKDSGSASGGDASVSVILYMGSQTVTPTVTATTGPGGTVPVTVDPRTPQEKESDIALILIDYGDMLVMFFIALTVIGGVKMIMK